MVGAPATVDDLDIAVRPNQVYLPFIANFSGALPPVVDLVGSIQLTPNKESYAAGESVSITVVITNAGTLPLPVNLSGKSEMRFWVDLFMNPAGTPTGRTFWDEQCEQERCFGIAWEITEPLGPGESVTLTSTPESYAEEYTIWPGWFLSGTSELHLYVDTTNRGPAWGNVQEFNEDNNRVVRPIQVTGENPPLLNSLPNVSDLPERPARP